jgi:diadenosine tetraphosphate (Ap4A) HIT family hydrolase
MNSYCAEPPLCTFCTELSGPNHSTNFGRLTSSLVDSRILWRNEHFAILPSLGPLRQGHLLIIPIEHIFSYENLTTDKLHQADQLIKVIYRYLISRRHKSIVAFEHGAPITHGDKREIRIRKAISGACTDHAHFHLVPDISTSQLRDKIEESKTIRDKFIVSDLTKLSENCNANLPYLILGGGDNDCWTIYLFDELQSQFMRQAVASIDGSKDWDWLLYPKIELVLNTCFKDGPVLKEYLKEYSTF